MPRVLSDSPRAHAIETAFLSAGGHVPEDIVLVLGGDGAMLRAIDQYGSVPTYFGVNCGLLGFLMNDLADDPAAAATVLREALGAGDWFAQPFPRLLVSATLTDGSVHVDRAVNDVYVERMSGQTCHLRVTVDGVVAVSRLVCDGLIAATPLGSTAYSFSAGGSAAHPLLRGIHLTAICPHVPRLAPIILPETALIHIEVDDPDRRPARAAVDGRQTDRVAAVDVRASGDHVRLGFLDGHDFTATLIRKILDRRER